MRLAEGETRAGQAREPGRGWGEDERSRSLVVANQARRKAKQVSWALQLKLWQTTWTLRKRSDLQASSLGALFLPARLTRYTGMDMGE